MQQYCTECGGPTRLRVPEGDSRPRHVCSLCGHVHYENPRIVAGCIVAEGDRVLLCRRAIEPRRGLWTLPAGFMENGETVEEAAARETHEEARAEVAPEALFTVFSLPHIDQVYMLFRARLTRPGYAPGTESLEVRMLREEEIPWDALAFEVVRQTLRLYFADLRQGRFGIHVGDLVRGEGEPARYECRLLGAGR